MVKATGFSTYYLTGQISTYYFENKILEIKKEFCNLLCDNYLKVLQ